VADGAGQQHGSAAARTAFQKVVLIQPSTLSKDAGSASTYFMKNIAPLNVGCIRSV
jgi:hypothetical protein